MRDLEFIVLIFVFGSSFGNYAATPKESNDVFEVTAHYSFGLSAFIGVLYTLILPVDFLNETLFPITKKEIPKVPYEEASISFMTDYDFENPMTRQECIDRLRKEAERLAEIEKTERDLRRSRILSKMSLK